MTGYIEIDVKSPTYNTFKFHCGNCFPNKRKFIVLTAALKEKRCRCENILSSMIEIIFLMNNAGLIPYN